MKIVCVGKLSAKLQSEHLTHGRLPCAHNSHDDDDHGRGYFLEYVF